MKKVILSLVILIMFSTAGFAQLTNNSLWYWQGRVNSTLFNFTNNTSLITNFYKFVVVQPLVNNQNIFPGDTYYLRLQIHNVGSKDETNGVYINSSCNDSAVSMSIYNDVNPADGSSFNSTVDVVNTSNKSPAILSGNNWYYFLRVNVPDNFTGTEFTVYVTNTGSVGTSPFPYKVIISNTFTVVHQNVLVQEANDGIHSITVFDGSEPLGNLDVKVYVRIEGTVIDTSSVRLYYDVDAIPDGSTPNGTTSRNRMVNLSKEGSFWVGTIPFTDPEIKTGKTVNFIVSADGHTYYRTGTTPWSYVVKEYSVQPQEGKNTISINNKFNPYNGETYHIIYKLNRNSFVNVSIYNIRGELVRQLKNKYESFGKYTVEWNGRNDENNLVSMGLYLAVVSTEDYNEIRKVIVIKR